MQVNRLNLVFPPGSASPAGTAAAASEVAQADVGKAQASASRAAAVSRPAPVAQEPSAPAAASASGVTLELGSAQKVAATGIYTRDGVIAGRISNAAADQTPAEHFVASAVNILRDFDAGKMALSPSITEGTAQALPSSRFASLRQAVGKLNVFA